MKDLPEIIVMFAVFCFLLWALLSPANPLNLDDGNIHRPEPTGTWSDYD